MNWTTVCYHINFSFAVGFSKTKLSVPIAKKINQLKSIYCLLDPWYRQVNFTIKMTMYRYIIWPEMFLHYSCMQCSFKRQFI